MIELLLQLAIELLVGLLHARAQIGHFLAELGQAARGAQADRKGVAREQPVRLDVRLRFFRIEPRPPQQIRGGGVREAVEGQGGGIPRFDLRRGS